MTLCAKGSFADDSVSGTTKLLRKMAEEKRGGGRELRTSQVVCGPNLLPERREQDDRRGEGFFIRAGESENDIRMCRGPGRKGKEGHHKRGTKKVYRANSLLLGNMLWDRLRI